MKKKMPYVGAAIGTIIAVAWILLTPAAAATSQPAPVEVAKPTLTHPQEVWMYALEWCESHGRIEAVNPKDKDGTPSYYSFQFKPSTFQYYGAKYGVVPAGLASTTLAADLKKYELQKAVVTEMILDSSHIDWHQQFPDCVRKLGTPPKK